MITLALGSALSKVERQIKHINNEWVRVAKKLVKDVTEIEIINDLTTKVFEKQQGQELVRYVYTHEFKAMSKVNIKPTD